MALILYGTNWREIGITLTASDSIPSVSPVGRDDITNERFVVLRCFVPDFWSPSLKCSKRPVGIVVKWSPMLRQRVRRDREADGLVRIAERLTVGRLILTKDVETPPELRAQRIQEINQELRRIEIRLTELKAGV